MTLQNGYADDYSPVFGICVLWRRHLQLRHTGDLQLHPFRQHRYAYHSEYIGTILGGKGGAIYNNAGR